MITLPQGHPYCREVVLNTILSSKNGLTVREAREQLPASRYLTQRMVRQVLDALVEDEVLDYEQPDGEVKVYFAADRPPRGRVRIVPASALPPIKLRRSTWFSPLGSLQ